MRETRLPNTRVRRISQAEYKRESRRHAGLFLTLRMEVTYSSETLVDFQRTTRCYIPEGSKLKLSYDIFLLQGVTTLPYASSMSHRHLVKAHSQVYLAVDRTR
jgi:hypothetical protein